MLQSYITSNKEHLQLNISVLHTFLIDYDTLQMFAHCIAYCI